MVNKKQLRHLYNDKKLSIMEITERLRVTHATIYYWFKKPKQKEDHGETVRILNRIPLKYWIEKQSDYCLDKFN